MSDEFIDYPIHPSIPSVIHLFVSRTGLSTWRVFSRGCEQAQELAREVRRGAVSLREEQIPPHSEVFMIQEVPGSGGLTGRVSGDLRGEIESQVKKPFYGSRGGAWKSH